MVAGLRVTARTSTSSSVWIRACSRTSSASSPTTSGTWSRSTRPRSLPGASASVVPSAGVRACRTRSCARSWPSTPSRRLTTSAGYGPSRNRQQYPTGHRNDQRNDSYWNFDLKFTKELNLGRGLNMQLSAEIFNLLNDGTYQIYNNPVFETGYQINGINSARFELRAPVAAGLQAGLLIVSESDSETGAALARGRLFSFPGHNADEPLQGTWVAPALASDVKIVYVFARDADLQHLDPPDGEPRADREGPRAPLHVRADRLRLRAHRQLPHLRVGGPAPPQPQVPRLPGDPGDEHHRRRGQDHPQVDRGGASDRRGDGAVHPGVLRGPGHPAHRTRRGVSAGHRPSPRDDRDRPGAGGQGSDLREPGVALFPDRCVSRIWLPVESG